MTKSEWRTCYKCGRVMSIRLGGRDPLNLIVDLRSAAVYPNTVIGKCPFCEAGYWYSFRSGRITRATPPSKPKDDEGGGK